MGMHGERITIIQRKLNCFTQQLLVSMKKHTESKNQSNDKTERLRFSVSHFGIWINFDTLV